MLVNLGHNYVFALVVMALFGATMSGDAPSIYSLVARQFSSSAGVAFGLVQAMGAVGSTAGPWMIGALGEHYGLTRAIWFGPVFLFFLSAISFSWEFIDRAHARRLGLTQSRPSFLV